MISKEYNVYVENMRLQIITSRVSAENFCDNKKSPLHRHISAELFAVVEGSADILTANERIKLTKGDIAVVPVSFLHCLEPTDKKAQVFAFAFMCNQSGDHWEKNIYKQIASLSCQDSVIVWKDCYSLCKMAFEICSEITEENEVITSLHALELLLALCGKKQELKTRSIEQKEKKYDINRMMLLDHIITGHYAEDISLDDVAKKLFISGRQLDRIVRKRYGKTLHNVIMEMRVREAADLLKNEPALTVDAVSKRVGFAYTSGFYREFSRIYGVTPIEFRKEKSKR